LAALGAQLADTRQAYRDLGGELTSLRAQLDEATEARAGLSAQLSGNEKTIAALRIELDLLRERLNASNQARAALDADAGALRLQLDECRQHAREVELALGGGQAGARLAKAPIVAAPERDDLEIINGIGPVFAKRFNAAGIHTFAQLAALTPDRTREIAAAQSWQKIDPEAWVAEAAHLAGLARRGKLAPDPERDDLEIINGIGPVFAKRFNVAGIHTFAQLAVLTPDRAREIAAAEEWQKIDPEAWIAEAAGRAAQKGG
jgi:predicted flap endonuclease-1-like 5' DNA nuclease